MVHQGIWCDRPNHARRHPAARLHRRNLAGRGSELDRARARRQSLVHGSRGHRADHAGTVTEFSLAPNVDPSSKITAGPDGNLWFAQFNEDRVGRITPDGTITLFTQGITANGTPSGITTGPDGRIWFAQYNGHRLGIITLEPPTAVTGGATSIRPDSASVTATVNPLDYPTTVRFDYGASAAYGSSSASVALAAGSADVAVPGELTGLTPRSTVHFRVVATSAIGTAMGSDVTLTTRPVPRVSTPIRRGFSLFPAYTRVTRLEGPARARWGDDPTSLQGQGLLQAREQVRLRRAVRSVDLRRRFLRRARLRPRACSRYASWPRRRSGRSCASDPENEAAPFAGALSAAERDAPQALLSRLLLS